MSKIKDFYSFSLHRRLLDRNIAEHSDFVDARVLDIGSKNRRYDKFFHNAEKIFAIDIMPEEGKGIIRADAHSLPFKDNSFDSVVSFEVFEYLLDIRRVLGEIARVLKKGGMLMFSVPFLGPVHGDVDRLRYTEKSLNIFLGENFKIRKSVLLGGRYEFIWDSFFEKMRNRSGDASKFFLLPFLFFSRVLAAHMDKRENNRRFPMGYFYVCEVNK